MQIHVGLNKAQVKQNDRLMRKAIKFGDLHENPLELTKQHMLSSVMLNFQAGGRPESWVPWEDDYREWRELINKPTGILMLDVRRGDFVRGGDLRKGIQVAPPNTEGTLLTAGENAPWAATHQFGFEEVPERPYFLYQDDDIPAIEKIFKDELQKDVTP